VNGHPFPVVRHGDRWLVVSAYPDDHGGPIVVRDAATQDEALTVSGRLHGEYWAACRSQNPAAFPESVPPDRCPVCHPQF
jgi:hypothetical protein